LSGNAYPPVGLAFAIAVAVAFTAPVTHPQQKTNQTKRTCDNANQQENSVKPSLRETVANTHIAAVTIAVLLLWSIDDEFHVLWEPIERMATFLFTSVAILDIPYHSPAPSMVAQISFLTTGLYMLSALTSFISAWLLSHWVYGVGPIRSLTQTCNQLRKGFHD
jgi:hypothetical protein